METVFGPRGDSAVLALTASSQAFALGTMPAINPAIRLISLNPSHLAWYLKFGTSGAVTVSRTDGMRLVPGSKEKPVVIPVPTGSTHVAILCEGASGDILASYGGFDNGEFSPVGASQIVAVTTTDQRIALPVLSTSQPAIRLISTASNIEALWIKLGDGSVTGSVSTSMKVFPGSVENPTIIPVTNSETHLSIFCEGVLGDLVLTPGGVNYTTTMATSVLMSAAPRILGLDTGAPAFAKELTITQVLDFLTGAAHGDIIYRDAAVWENLAAGTAGQFLQTQGAGADPSWAAPDVVAVAAGALSSVATLDIALGTADLYEIDLMSLIPATDNVSLISRLSQSGSFLSGASDYAYNFHQGGTETNDLANDSAVLINLCGNGATEAGTVTLRIFRPSAAAFVKNLTWLGCSAIAADGGPRAVKGCARLLANTNAIDGVRFLYSSGNIASGYYAMRSYSFT